MGNSTWPHTGGWGKGVGFTDTHAAKTSKISIRYKENRQAGCYRMYVCMLGWEVCSGRLAENWGSQPAMPQGIKLGKVVGNKGGWWEGLWGGRA